MPILCNIIQFIYEIGHKSGVGPVNSKLVCVDT